MINLPREKPRSSPPSYWVVKLSNGEVFYESNEVNSWRVLHDYCTKNDLKIVELKVINSDGERVVSRNHKKFYFVIRDVTAFGNARLPTIVRKGYGVTCLHPGNLHRAYIQWYDDSNGKFVYTEVLRDVPSFYEKEIGIPAA